MGGIKQLEIECIVKESIWTDYIDVEGVKKEHLNTKRLNDKQLDAMHLEQ